MYTTKEAITERTGYEMDQQGLALAQMMIEAWTGKSEEEVTDATDRARLADAVTFQAVYIKGVAPDVLQQMALTSLTQGESTYRFDPHMFSPYMSPWAIMACQKLSWMGTRTVHTGPVFDKRGAVSRWETT